MSELFKEFIGKNVKVPYRDGDFIRVAKGTMTNYDTGFIRIEGDKGVLLINCIDIIRIGAYQDGGYTG